jgi:hypothetical protein
VEYESYFSRPGHSTRLRKGVMNYSNSSKQRTCFPVNPWQMTFVFLSTHTLAVELMLRAAAAERIVFLETRDSIFLCTTAMRDEIYQVVSDHGNMEKKDAQNHKMNNKFQVWT